MKNPEWRSERGASAVEFALVLPLLLLILFGTIEFGVLLFNKQVITNASREGARFGIVAETPRKDENSIESVVKNYTSNNLVTFGIQNTPQVTVIKSGENRGDDLTVRVQYSFVFLVLPNFASTLAGGINLVSEAVMKYE